MKQERDRTGRVRRWTVLVLSLILPVFIFFGWSMTEPGETIELAWRDFLYTVRGIRNPPEDVVIVAIDEPSFQEIAIHWPWPRGLHALLIEQLSNSGASVIAFDIVFVEPSADPVDDEALARAARNAGNVVFSAHISQTVRQEYKHSMFVKPLPILADAAKYTAIANLVPDPDGIIREGIECLEGMPSLAFAAAAASGRISPEQIPDEDMSFLIDFAGPSGTITTASYYQVLAGDLPADFFKDKLVLVGLALETAVEVEGAVDAFPTSFFRLSRKMMYGVEIHANAVATLLAHCPLRLASSPWLPPVLVFLAFIPFLVRKRPVVLAALISGTVAGLGGISVLLFVSHDLVLDVVPAMAATLGNGLWWGIREYWTTTREKRQIKGAFDRYVTPDVVREVLRNPDLLRLGGQKRELTVLFSDIRGFTTLSESLDPEQLVSLLNVYLTRMTDKVFEHNGTLDKYIGDAMMAIFGAPLPYQDHAVCACRTALDMLKALDGLAVDWESRGLPPPRIGIGINTGPMVVGNMGSDRRFDYTVMGDEVNLASRLEGVTKAYTISTIISENTKNALDSGFVCRELDLVRVKGKKQPIKIYELVADGKLSDKWEVVLSEFSRGLAAYRELSWANARDAFEAVLRVRPEDGPSKVFLSRCDVFANDPPPRDWDGVWTMTSK